MTRQERDALRQLQDRYLALPMFRHYRDDEVIFTADGHPGPTVGELREYLYPELRGEMWRRLASGPTAKTA